MCAFVCEKNCYFQINCSLIRHGARKHVPTPLRVANSCRNKDVVLHCDGETTIFPVGKIEANFFRFLFPVTLSPKGKLDTANHDLFFLVYLQSQQGIKEYKNNNMSVVI